MRGIEKKTPAEEALTDKGSYHILRKYSYNDLDELRNLKEYRVEGENSDGTGTLTHETSYTYDALGNRKSETKDGIKYVYGYDDLNELLWVEKEGESEKQKKYTYDEDGNQVSEINAEAGTETTYAYDLEGNMLKSVSRARKNGETVETVTENQYNGDGTRVSRTVNGETTYFLYANGNLIGSYTMDSSNQEIVSKHTANVFGINGDIILTIRTGTKSYVYNADIRGSIMSITDDNGDVVQSCYYSVFGEPSVEGTFYNEILYTGAVYDSSTGMYYLSTRFYDSESGRFTSRDSVRGSVDNPLSLNIYAYCVNNPLKYTDEEGEMPTVVVTALIGGTLSAATEYLSQKAEGRKKISWKDVVISAAGGAISASVPILTEKKVVHAVTDIVVGAGSYYASNGKGGTGMLVAGVENYTTGQLLGGISKKLGVKDPRKNLDTIKYIRKNEKIRVKKKIAKRKAVNHHRKKAKLKKKPLKTRIKRFFSSHKKLKSVRRGIRKLQRKVYSSVVGNHLVSGIHSIAKRAMSRYKAVKRTVHRWSSFVKRKFKRWF